MTNNLTKKISFVRQTSNNTLTDNPVYEVLFITYANISFNGTGSFNTARGTDILKASATVQIRATANIKNISLDNLFICYNNQYYKVITPITEADIAGIYKFNVESVI